MSVMTVTAPASGRLRQRSTESLAGPVRQRPGRQQRPGRGSGRAGGPHTRPANGVAPPRLRTDTAVGARACVAAPAPVRLTDRGIAVIMVAGMMLVVAALVVIGATAARVTSENYRPTVQSQVAQDSGTDAAPAFSARS